MNVQRNFNPILFEILNIPARQMSKAMLSKELGKWIDNNYSKNSGVITSDSILYELSNIPIGDTYNLIGDGWWNFVTKVYLKWVIRI